MNLRILTAGAILVLAAGCSSMKIGHDYDHQADFSSYKTYAWHEGKYTVADTEPLVHQRFVQAVDRALAAKGLKKVDSNPDLYVTYNAEEREQMSIDTTYMGGGWGYGPGWGWGGMGGMGSASTTVRTYNVGTVVLDLWDAEQKRLVWRGTASDTVSENRKESEKKIQKAVTKLFEKYPPTGS